MPYPNEHSCRLKDPGKYDRFKRDNCGEKSDGKCIDVIYGIKDNKSEIQALRYSKEDWTEKAARKHCEGRDGKFEPAKDEEKSMKNELEIRMFETLEVRSEEGKPLQMVGYAAVFDKLSLDLGGFREKIARGTFKRTLGELEAGKRVIIATFNHDVNFLLASTANGTLRLKEDERGLWTEMEPMLTPLNEHPLMLVKAKGVRGMSFKFMVQPNGKDQWEYKKGQEPIRTLLDVDLFDVAAVVEPAYPQTSVKVRDYLNALKAAEEELDGQGAPGTGRVGGLAKSRLNYGYPIHK